MMDEVERLARLMHDAYGEEYRQRIIARMPDAVVQGVPTFEQLGPTARGCVMAMAAAVAMEVKKLADFKDYVHARLDEAGVPVDPESPHRAEGCRIGGRLDEVFARQADLVIACKAAHSVATYDWQEATERGWCQVAKERSAIIALIETALNRAGVTL